MDLAANQFVPRDAVPTPAVADAVEESCGEAKQTQEHTEYIEEIIEIDGQKYVQRWEKRRLYTTEKSRQIITAPINSEGLPDWQSSSDEEEDERDQTDAVTFEQNGKTTSGAISSKEEDANTAIGEILKADKTVGVFQEEDLFQVQMNQVFSDLPELFSVPDLDEGLSVQLRSGFQSHGTSWNIKSSQKNDSNEQTQSFSILKRFNEQLPSGAIVHTKTKIRKIFKTRTRKSLSDNNNESETKQSSDNLAELMIEDASHLINWCKDEDPKCPFKSGSINALIAYATGSDELQRTAQNYFLFHETFVTSYRCFIEPLDLIQRLIERFKHFTSHSEIPMRILNLIRSIIKQLLRWGPRSDKSHNQTSIKTASPIPKVIQAPLISNDIKTSSAAPETASMENELELIFHELMKLRESQDKKYSAHLDCLLGRIACYLREYSSNQNIANGENHSKCDIVVSPQTISLSHPKTSSLSSSSNALTEQKKNTESPRRSPRFLSPSKSPKKSSSKLSPIKLIGTAKASSTHAISSMLLGTSSTSSISDQSLPIGSPLCSWKNFDATKLAEQITWLDWQGFREVELLDLLDIRDSNQKQHLRGYMAFTKRVKQIIDWVRSSLLLAGKKQTSCSNTPLHHESDNQDSKNMAILSSPSLSASDPSRKFKKNRKECFLRILQLNEALATLNNFSSEYAVSIALLLMPLEKMFSEKFLNKHYWTSNMCKTARDGQRTSRVPDLKDLKERMRQLLLVQQEDVGKGQNSHHQQHQKSYVPHIGFMVQTLTQFNNIHKTSIRNEGDSGEQVNFWRCCKTCIILWNTVRKHDLEEEDENWKADEDNAIDLRLTTSISTPLPPRLNKETKHEYAQLIRADPQIQQWIECSLTRDTLSQAEIDRAISQINAAARQNHPPHHSSQNRRLSSLINRKHDR